ncbi:uncharacterized protein ColSpa_10290 [Colletotrichum spaethianum]|uniref:Ecp2 effector protein domain-containing protein n=1 Tax=Colletotrichum spaethianum TaxID=700344 RepID=A0AA37PDC1_9PEZI|nr:uncharacterized protein ColSpa_10290 [Colletotrichum spaethianum]GKT50109.1 hypothetical protein ColSpa_10290 [Colletotrichum spaethianum]
MFFSRCTTFPLVFMATATWAFGRDAPSPGAPIQGYGIFIPRWEVPSPDGSGKTISVRGTVEEVAAQMLDMKPSFDVDEQFGKIAITPIGRRAAFGDDTSTLCHNFREGNRSAVHVSIDQLKTVQGRPQNGAGPGNCGRVSCRDNTGIWFCNDAQSPKELGSFKDIADGAQRVLDKCQDKLDANQGEGMTVSGQAYHKDNWNVVVRGGESCDNAGIDINSGGLGRFLRVKRD